MNIQEDINVNKLEQIVADHNKAMRTDMASEITGGTRSKSITDVITVRAILDWHNKELANLIAIKELENRIDELDTLGNVEFENVPMDIINYRYERKADLEQQLLKLKENNNEIKKRR